MTTLFLFLLEQDEATGYDTYSSCVVAAEGWDDASTIHPNPRLLGVRWWENDDWNGEDWATTPRRVKVTLLGTAKPSIARGVICASFHAG